MKLFKKYNHMFDMAFSLESFDSDGDDVTASDIRLAIMRRLASLDDEELLEAIGMPLDTYEIEEE